MSRTSRWNRISDATRSAARELLDRIEADRRWETALSDSRSEALLRRLADDAREP